MTKDEIDLLVLLADLQLISLVTLRHFLNEFLIGARNRKRAQEIYRQQSLRNRVTLSFIKSFLDESISVFNVYHTVYMIALSSIIPQYVAIIFTDERLNRRLIIMLMLIVYGLLFIIVRLQLNSLWRSRYSKGK
jgi:ABC-type bacteriocin/lantibiotic exporter with double-glycine peptidase domain